MVIDTINKEGVRGRALVDELAPRDSSLALKAAREIQHPWYRCQSLSTVAEHLDADPKRDVLLEALNAAQQQTEINRIVTVSSWPMEQLAKLAPELAYDEIKALVTLANTEPHPLRRADALFHLAGSVSEVHSLLKLIVPSLVQALLIGHGWRIDGLIRDSIELVKVAQPEALASVVAHHSENRKKRKLLASLHGMRH